MYETIVKDNFLSHDELSFIETNVYKSDCHYDDVVDNKLNGFYKPWQYYNKNYSILKDVLHPKLEQVFDYDFIIDHSHIIDSHVPYDVHTDYWQVRNFKHLEPAHSVIIPLDNYNSNTIIFNEVSKIKRIDEYIDKVKPKYSTAKISLEDKEKYLSHVDQDILDYLSIKEIFKWKKGCLFAFDRQYFHCSDNYYANGLNGKKALILWTSTKI